MTSASSIIKEGKLRFTFPDNAKASKYDEWTFYKKHFQRIQDTKAVDIVYIDGKTLWLIEIKDYRSNPRTKVISLGREVAQKARDTLAGLAAAQCNANNLDERQFAEKALQVESIRVVLHLEKPGKATSRRIPRSSNRDRRFLDLANVRRSMKKHLKAIDPQAKVLDRNTPKPRVNWQVTSA